MRLKNWIYFIIILLPGKSLFTQGCAIDTEVTIQALQTTDVILSISNLLNDDLAIDQSICGVQLVFEHDQLENLRITLTSPDGDEITLVGPGTLGSILTNLIAWNITFTQCVNPSAPDVGISGQWDNNQLWESFQNYNGIYHPFQNCLEDFNSGSANGNWVLSIENLGLAEGILFYFEIILCNDTGNDCSSCFLHSGDFDNDFEVFCEDDVRLDNINSFLNNNFIIDASQRFEYVLGATDSIFYFNEDVEQLDNLLPGTYQICGLSYAIEDSLIIHDQIYLSGIEVLIDQRQVCADLSAVCFTFEILAANEMVTIDTSFCKGDTIWINSIPIFSSIDTLVTVFDTTSNLPFTISCDSIINIHATEINIEALVNVADPVVHCGIPVFLNGINSLSDPVPIINYFWTTVDGNLINAVGPIAEINSGGSYVLHVTNQFCEDSLTVLIDNDDSFNIAILSDPTICSYDTMRVVLDADVKLDSFIIQGPTIVDQDAISFQTVENGLYNIFSYYGDCEIESDIDLMNEATEIEIEVSTTMIDCYNMSSEILIQTNVNDPLLYYEGPEIILDNTINPIVVTPGQYSLTVTDEYGCEASSVFSVAENIDNPLISAEDISRSCSQDSVMLPLIINSAVDSIIWLGPNGFVSKQLNPNVFDEGVYQLVVFGTNGCSVDTTILLTVTNEAILFDVTGNDLDCVSDRVELCVQAPINLDSVSWVYNNNFISGDECVMVDVAGEYQVVIFDEKGCSGINSFVVEDLRIPIDVEIQTGSSILTCNNNSIQLEAFINSGPSNLTMNWLEEGVSLSTNTILTISEEGNYIFEVSDPISGCEDSDSILITSSINALADVFIESVDPKCQGETGEITINNLPDTGIFDIFLNDSPVEMPSSLQNLSSDSYEIEIVSDEGCIFDSIIIINEGNFVDVDLGNDIFANLGEQIDLNVNLSLPLDQLSLYQWSHPELLSCLDCLNPIFTVGSDAILSLNISDMSGCEASDELLIRVDKNVKLFIPNIFTPDGDGNNDVLTIFISDQIVKIYDIRIIDRWGNLLFFHPEITKEVNNFSWDGTSDGKAIGSGVYVFIATLLLIDSTETIIVGDISLLR